MEQPLNMDICHDNKEAAPHDENVGEVRHDNKEEAPHDENVGEVCHDNKEEAPHDENVGEVDENIVKDGSLNWRGRAAKRSITGGWKACFFLICMEMAERVAFISIASNLVQYLSLVMKESLSSSVKNTYNWYGVTTVIPFFGGFIADTYLGRLLSIAIFSIVYLLGMIILTLSTRIDILKPPCLKDTSQKCGVPTPFQVSFFFLGLYLISIGNGGMKPCLQALGGDQFDEDHPEEKRRKSSFFIWWNFGIFIGILVAITVIVYIQINIGWNVGFSISTASMGLAAVIFFAGIPFYRHKAINRSPITQIIQVLVAALRKHNVQVPTNEDLLYEVHKDSMQVTRRQLQHSNKFKFLDKAATPLCSDFSHNLEDSATGRVNPWRLCTITQVEDVKLLLQILPIWLTSFMFGIFIAQQSTLFIKQGAAMDTQIGSTTFHIPPPSFGAFAIISSILAVPIFDFLLVPTARAMTGHERGITLLQRIGVGQFFSIISMLAAALTEARRLRGAIEGKPPLSIFWLLPQYIIAGFADVFSFVGVQEFFYDQVPDGMRSLGLALYLATLGVGSFLSTFLIILVQHVTHLHGSKTWFGPDINSSHLDYYFWFLVVLGVINLLLFLMVAHFYHYKKPKRES